MPRLEALASAVPEHRLAQREVVEIARAFLELNAPDLLPLLPVFESAGVETRSLAMPIEWYLGSPGWRARSEEYVRVGTELLARTTQQLLADAAVGPGSIDGVVLVSSTGLATPSLDARLVNRLRLREDVLRVPVWGLGCAGGVAGLARAADLARAHPSKRFLFLALELCSLAFLGADLSKKNVVAAALFGDGCAGALVTGDDVRATGPTFEGAASHQWPDTEGVMGWDVRDEGLAVVFSREIPRIVEEGFAPVHARFTKEHGLAPDEPRLLFHPGGSKVIDAFEVALGVPPARFAETRAILREHGNMSSPTALFVLERSLRQRALDEGEPAALAALGPGFAAEFALLRG